MKTLVILMIIATTACSTAKVRVMPGEDGVHTSVAKDIEREGAEEASVKAANEYCKGKKQEAVFMKDESKYKGSMDEDTRKNVRNASNAAVMLGGIGSAVSSAGMVGHSMTNNRDYESVVKFKCK